MFNYLVQVWECFEYYGMYSVTLFHVPGFVVFGHENCMMKVVLNGVAFDADVTISFTF